MATKEVSKALSLPPYPEMIFAALDALKEKEGSSKSAISQYIESTYGDLPAGHTNLLTQHLIKMKESGQLAMAKNNYMKPDPNAPPKRGRGRPPKSKESVDPPETDISPPRGRGRPKKDPNAAPAPKKVKPAASSGEPMPSKTGRPRGRPRKVQPQQAQNGEQES